MNFFRGLLMLLIAGVAYSTSAFSLLGPYAEWMDETNGFRRPWDIGGPMNVGEEYRWNTPVITYGFDEQFIATFGQDGINTVESAINLLNSIPPASQINLTNYDFVTSRFNYQASSWTAYDLKSMTLSLLTEQLGLTDPVRCAFVLRSMEITNQSTNFNVVIRHFFDDASTISTNQVLINGSLATYDGFIRSTNPITSMVSISPRISWFSSGSSEYPVTRVRNLESGRFIVSFSQDDLAGLQYLYSPTNLNIETIPTGTTGIGENASNVVVTALRPGVDKVTFLRQGFDSAEKRFIPMTNDYQDLFYSNNIMHTQMLRRISTEPDIVFSARDFGSTVSTGTYKVGGVDHKYRQFSLKPFERTGTGGWINNSQLNGGSASGPGNIKPGIKITFQDMWRYVRAMGIQPSESLDLQTQGNGYEIFFSGAWHWATFDSTNLTLLHSAETNAAPVSLESRISETNSFVWTVLANKDAVYDIQSSTNLNEWATVQTFTNSDVIHTFVDTNLHANGFYRVVRVSSASAEP